MIVDAQDRHKRAVFGAARRTDFNGMQFAIGVGEFKFFADIKTAAPKTALL